MSREKFDRQKEHEVIGTYPPIKGLELGAGSGKGVRIIPESPRLYRPISPNENFKMLFRGQTPYWMPSVGWFNCDLNQFRPRQHPDNLANHQCIDGGEYVDYTKVPKLNTGWLGLPLEWEPVAMGASVRPGHPQLPEMTGWREKIQMPDLDAMDWDEIKAMNKSYLDVDKANQLGIQLGLWERMMCLMDVDNACVALLDEDQEEDIHEFLDELSDIYVDYIRRMLDVGRIDSIFFHDDWGTQNGPFFSLETCRTFFVKPMKKIVDFCHAHDIIFEHHCCGKAETLVPAMDEAGVDFWFPQYTINDVDKLVDTYQDSHITFAVTTPIIPRGSTQEDVRAQAKAFVDKYKDKGVLFRHNGDILANPEHDESLYPLFADAVYEFSRIAYQSVED